MHRWLFRRLIWASLRKDPLPVVFMLITIQPRCFASSMSACVNVPNFVSARATRGAVGHTHVPHHRAGRACTVVLPFANSLGLDSLDQSVTTSCVGPVSEPAAIPPGREIRPLPCMLPRHCGSAPASCPIASTVHSLDGGRPPACLLLRQPCGIATPWSRWPCSRSSFYPSSIRAPALQLDHQLCDLAGEGERHLDDRRGVGRARQPCQMKSLSSCSWTHVRQSAAHRRVGDRDQPVKRAIHLQDQENRRGQGKRAHEQRRRNGGVAWGKQAEGS